MDNKYVNLFFWGLVLALVVVRFFHLGPFIDGPHEWRQCDTANYIWDFYKNGIHLLQPAVCWMGHHKTLILEFPLPEAFVAIFYKLFSPQLVFARLAFLLIYLGSAYFLFRVIQLLYSRSLALLSVIIYLAMPLGIYYSRAIHIDFSAILLALAATYYFLKGAIEKRTLLILSGSLLMTVGLMIKAPYLFYIPIPILFYVITRQKHALPKLIPAFIFPAFIFYGWQAYVQQVNGNAPNWDFIPGYSKFTNMADWYFGNFTMRSNLYYWDTIMDRLVLEGTGSLGCILLLIGLLFSKADGWSTLYLRIWLVSCLMYVLIFFNPNIIHNYYQIPFLPVMAVFIALTLYQFHQWISKKNLKLSYGILFVLLLGMSVENIIYAESHYYNVKHHFVEAGRIVREETQPDDLILFSTKGADCRTPTLLYRARRKGWSININDLNITLIDSLRKEGIKYMGLVTDGHLENKKWLERFKYNIYPLPEDKSLYLYSFKE